MELLWLTFKKFFVKLLKFHYPDEIPILFPKFYEPDIADFVRLMLIFLPMQRSGVTLLR